MASKSEKKGLAIISIATGAVRLMKNEDRFSRIDMKENLVALDKEFGKIRDRYCRATEKDLKKICGYLHKWSEVVDIPENINTLVLVNIAILSLSDLLDKLTNKVRCADISYMIKELEIYSNFLDPQGKSFSAYSEADYILDKFYSCIGGRP